MFYFYHIYIILYLYYNHIIVILYLYYNYIIFIFISYLYCTYIYIYTILHLRCGHSFLPSFFPSFLTSSILSFLPSYWEVGQSVVIALSILIWNIVQLHRIPLEFPECRVSLKQNSPTRSLRVRTHLKQWQIQTGRHPAYPFRVWSFEFVAQFGPLDILYLYYITIIL